MVFGKTVQRMRDFKAIPIDTIRGILIPKCPMRLRSILEILFIVSVLLLVVPAWRDGSVEKSQLMRMPKSPTLTKPGFSLLSSCKHNMRRVLGGLCSVTENPSAGRSTSVRSASPCPRATGASAKWSESISPACRYCRMVEKHRL
jgi:hypothetical protein